MSMSSLGKYAITIDPTDLTNGDSIAAYLTSAAGVLLESATINGNESLWTVSASEFVEDTAHTSGDRGVQVLSVRHDDDATGVVSADGDYAPLLVDATGRLKVSASIDVVSNTTYAEDSPFTNGDQGDAVLLVRQDTLATSTSADGDYGSFKSTSLGELYVFDTTTHTTLTSILTELQNTNYAEDSPHVSGDLGVMSLAVRNDVVGSLVSANGDYAPLQVDAAGSLRVVGTFTLTSQFAEDSAHVSGDSGIHTLSVRKDALSTNVSADGDYASNLQWSEGSLKVVDIPNIAVTTAAVSVDNTVGGTSLGASIANRRSIQIQNRGLTAVFVGVTGVTTASGIEVPRGAVQQLDLGPAVTLFAIAPTAVASDVRVMQIS